MKDYARIPQSQLPNRENKHFCYWSGFDGLRKMSWVTKSFKLGEIITAVQETLIELGVETMLRIYHLNLEVVIFKIDF